LKIWAIDRSFSYPWIDSGCSQFLLSLAHPINNKEITKMKEYFKNQKVIWLKTEGKMCPILKDFCCGRRCAFAVEGKNSSINEESKFVVTGTYHYCVVRDFMLTICIKEWIRMTEEPMDNGEAFKIQQLENLRNMDMTKPKIGDNVIKFAKSVLVCCRCQTQVEIFDFFASGLPMYWCVKDTCPAFQRIRKRKQRFWLDYQTSFEYRKVGIIQWSKFVLLQSGETERKGFLISFSVIDDRLNRWN